MMALVAMLGENLDCFQKSNNPKKSAAITRAHLSFQYVKSEQWKLVKLLVIFKKEAESNRDSTGGFRWCQNNSLMFSKLKASLRALGLLKTSCARFNLGVNKNKC